LCSAEFQNDDRFGRGKPATCHDVGSVVRGRGRRVVTLECDSTIRAGRSVNSNSYVTPPSQGTQVYEREFVLRSTSQVYPVRQGMVQRISAPTAGMRRRGGVPKYPRYPGHNTERGRRGPLLPSTTTVSTSGTSWASGNQDQDDPSPRAEVAVGGLQWHRIGE